MKILPGGGQVLRIDVPEWFALEAFRAAVERNTSPTADARLTTIHRHGAPFTDSSDIYIVFNAFIVFEVYADDQSPTPIHGRCRAAVLAPAIYGGVDVPP